jgi:hypothetical protein
MVASGDDDAVEQLPLLRRRVVDLESEVLELRLQLEQVQRSRAELGFAGLVDSVGLAVALGEATMPQHAISSVSVSAKGYLVPTGEGIGVRFQPPELAHSAVGQSTTTFELAKVPGEGPAAPSLYAVLDEKQRLYSREPWASRKDARRLVTELRQTLAAADSWTLEFLAEQATVIARLERRLAGVARTGAAAEARGTITELASLAGGLGKRRPGAGDVHALASALRATTAALVAVAARQTAARPRSSRSKPAP